MPNHEIGCLNHCPGGGHGGGGGWLVLPVLIVFAIIAAGAWKVRHGIETGVEIGLWVTGGVVGLILVTAITIVVAKIVRRSRSVQLWRPAQPVARQEPAYQITQMGTHRTVRGAIEAPRDQPETDPGYWLGDTDEPARTPAPVPAPPRENPRSRAPRQETGNRDEARYHSRFR
jgi:hypothetical protein